MMEHIDPIKPQQKRRRRFADDEERREFTKARHADNNKTRICIGKENLTEWHRQKALCGLPATASANAEFVSHLLALHEQYCASLNDAKLNTETTTSLDLNAAFAQQEAARISNSSHATSLTDTTSNSSHDTLLTDTMSNSSHATSLTDGMNTSSHATSLIEAMTNSSHATSFTKATDDKNIADTHSADPLTEATTNNKHTADTRSADHDHKCSVCGRQFVNRQGVQRHMQTHKKVITFLK